MRFVGLFVAVLVMLTAPGCGPQEAAPPPAPEKSKAELQRAEFFGADVAADASVAWRNSGLGVKLLVTGTGPLPKLTDRIRIHYTGRLKDGTVFDDTREKGKPADFALNQMISGMTAGISALPAGSRAILYVPPSLGYGSMRAGKIPPVSGLIFDVELLAVNP